MFRESLLESSLSRRHQKRWPMAIAFVLESIAAGIVIVVPLLSTGVIPVSAHVHHITPLPMVRVDTERVHSSFPSRNNVLHSSDSVVPVSNNPNQIHYGDSRPVTRSVIPNAGFDVGPRPPGPDVAACSDCLPVVQPPIHEKPISLSHLSEAQLVHRVEPVYPRMAVLASLQGEVRLHAHHCKRWNHSKLERDKRAADSGTSCARSRPAMALPSLSAEWQGGGG